MRCSKENANGNTFENGWNAVFRHRKTTPDHVSRRCNFYIATEVDGGIILRAVLRAIIANCCEYIRTQRKTPAMLQGWVFDLLYYLWFTSTLSSLARKHSNN